VEKIETTLETGGEDRKYRSISFKYTLKYSSLARV
jgi:hypothetical protein